MQSQPVRRLSTRRLDLVASTLDHLLAELESAERLASSLNVRIGPGWPPGEYDREAQELFRDRLLEGGEDVVGWYGWYAIRREADGQPAQVVAAGGFLGPPGDDGIVEIGYSVVESFQRQGFATEIVEALVCMAFRDPRVRVVVGRAAAENRGSLAVLVRAGFVQASHADGDATLRFELARETMEG